MDIQRYIESGILEEYCLGLLDMEQQQRVFETSLLYPEIKQELNAIEQSIQKLAESNAIVPDSSIKNRILNSLGFSTGKLDLNNLPVIDKYTQSEDWLAVLNHLLPDGEPAEDFKFEVLRKGDKLSQTFVVTKLDVPQETHTTLIESLFILQGACRCTVGNDIFDLKQGDFLEIPLHIVHDIKLVTPYVTAILQERFV